MSTLIGQRERIAVEFELKEVEPELRKWLYGTMSLWAGGNGICARSMFPMRMR